MFRIRGFTLIEILIVFTIIGILGVILYGSMQERERRIDERDDVKTEAQQKVADWLVRDSTNFGRILNPDGTPVRPSNDQIGHYTDNPSVEGVVGEQCIDGIIYLFVTKNNKDFMAPKEDTFGYNVKCSE